MQTKFIQEFWLEIRRRQKTFPFWNVLALHTFWMLPKVLGQNIASIWHQNITKDQELPIWVYPCGIVPTWTSYHIWAVQRNSSRMPWEMGRNVLSIVKWECPGHVALPWLTLWSMRAWEPLKFWELSERDGTWGMCDNYLPAHGLRTPNEAFFSSKSQAYGLGQTIWADKFCGIWGIFVQFISTHFGIGIWIWVAKN